jgi:hypothetical protein
MENPLEEGGLKLNYLNDMLKIQKLWLKIFWNWSRDMDVEPWRS